MECFLCEQDAAQECPRCGALYCDDHGDALCERCIDPTLALPSYRIYRGSLLALLVGSVFAIWLLVQPPDGADLDAPERERPPPRISDSPVAVAPSAPPPASTPVTRSGAVASPTATATPTPTPTATATPQPTVQEYTVQVGDTLILIAERFMPAGGDLDAYVVELAELNGISDIALVQIDQVLRIPPP